ncbi:hypothetical protein [Atopobium sp. oral taxon 416]|uniref:hypothetical protein n=1 Tax=Atopobium sp. oral taxon 416 TaxID=712157 RepID=UPI001BA617D6|nr:hypothetical protein [Atopobium sp. oral taxon 416]QUC03192.1 hypothetical protein J4859_14595 [Atopobium sp. oral taxon 416]
MKSAKTAGVLLCDRAKQLVAENPQKHARPKANDQVFSRVQAARKKATAIKRSAYFSGKVPNPLTQNKKIRLDMI